MRGWAAMKITFEGAKAYRQAPWRRRLARVGAVAAAVLMLATIAIGAGPHLELSAFAIAGLLFVGGELIQRGGASMRQNPGTLAAGREGLYAGERLLVPRARVRGALPTRHRDMGDVLLLLTDSGPLLIDVDRADTTRRLAGALELDAERRRTEVRYPTPMGILIAVAVASSLLLAGLVSALWPNAPAPIAMALVPLAAIMLVETTLTLGDDGVSLRTLGRERFIPYADVANVNAAESANAHQRVAPQLEMRSGRGVKLGRPPALQSRSGVQIDEAVLDLLREGLESYRTRAERAPVLPLSLSAQSTGSPADRVRALTAKDHDDGAYRRSATDKDALRRAVDEPTLSPRLRAEAALALGAAGNPDDLERIRRVAERSACRPLRQLFEAVADGAGEAKLARALGRVA